MKSNCNRYQPSDTCGKITESPCVRVEIDFPEISGLTEESCVRLDYALEDIYEILEKYNLSEYDKKCLEQEGQNLVHILQSQTDKICELEERVSELEDPCQIFKRPISECGIDVSCLQQNDPCDPVTPITTFGDLINKLIQKNCE